MVQIREVHAPQTAPSTADHDPAGVPGSDVRSEPQQLPAALEDRRSRRPHPGAAGAVERTDLLRVLRQREVPRRRDPALWLWRQRPPHRGNVHPRQNRGHQRDVPEQPRRPLRKHRSHAPHRANTASSGRTSPTKATTSAAKSSRWPPNTRPQTASNSTKNTPVTITGCPKAKTNAQKLAAALKACHKDKNKAKRESCEKVARNKYGAKASKSSKKRRK